MVVLGAGGLAKELIDIITTNYNFNKENLYFFDEINTKNDSLYGFRILHSAKEVQNVFNTSSNQFCLAIGTPKARYDLTKKFEQIGGKLTSIVSTKSIIGSYDVKIGDGSCVMNLAAISNGVTLGKGVLINADVLAGHDVTVGDFSDISPGVKITGHCQIGKYVTIGTGATVLPKVSIGDNSFIGAGSVVSNDVPKNSMVVGILPTRVVKLLAEFEE